MFPTLPFHFPQTTQNLPLYPQMLFNPPFNPNPSIKFPIQPPRPANLQQNILQNQINALSLYTQLLQQQRLNTIPTANPQAKFSPMVIKSPEFANIEAVKSLEAQMLMAKTAHSLPLQVKEETDDTDTSEKSGSSSGSKLQAGSKKIAKERRSPKALKSEEGKKTRMSWNPTEDAKLLGLIEIHGKRWAKLASLMEGRSGKQVRDRYLNVLIPDINRGRWMEDEDNMVWKLYKEIGPQWCRIAERLEGRTEAQVKNRFYTYLKKHFENKKEEEI